MRFFNIFFFIIFGVTSTLSAQMGVVFGKITDNITNEGLTSANVEYNNQGEFADFEGNYRINLPAGKYVLTFSYVGYEAQEVTVEVVAGKEEEVNVRLKSDLSFQEVVKTADIAIERKTPISFSNISTKQLAEELSSQDLPMVLNSTPGAYATQSGGGDGDARVTIRGFNQRNVAVMLDGVPVNDMENGWVYWSNWFGLDLVTSTMQVQRGLGASKLAIPSVGGTINIITKGIKSNPSLKFKQEIGTGGYSRSTLGWNSGRLKGGWGLSLAGSYKQGNGWVEGTFTKGYFYYLKAEKSFDNHLISFTGFGAPQEHGQRPFKDAIGVFDSEYALANGVSQANLDDLKLTNFVTNVGRKYNEHIGTLNGETINTRQNFYHKPQFNLRHSWTVNDKLYISNLAFLSIGNGGGVGPLSTMPKTNEGYVDLQRVYDTNSTTSIFNPNNRSTNILRASMNNHFWYGLLSNIKYDVSPNLTLSGGLDLRYYEGNHYRTVHDLVGGKYFTSVGNSRIDQDATQLQVGDKFQYDNTGFVNWAGVFGLMEYSQDKWSAFLNLSAAQVGYAMEDYMKPKVVTLADTSFYVSYDAPVDHENKTYTVDSEEAKNQRIDWIYIPSFTFKTGASYRINEAHSVFVNTGYLSRPTRYTNMIRSNTFNSQPITQFTNAENEIIYAFEAGYKFRSTVFSGNINGYWTNWLNKPLDSTPTVLSDPTDPESERIPVNINGVAALHKGIELDFAVKIIKGLELQGLASFGDWIWNSAATVELPGGGSYKFDAKGVHVGDAAQTQLGIMVRYEPIKGLYFKLRSTYFGNNYADFTPESLSGATAQQESWKMPDYYLVDFHSGYNFKVAKTKMGVRFNVLNVLDALYLTDGRNNDGFVQAYNEFDAKSASVFFGLGRRWNLSFNITL